MKSLKKVQGISFDDILSFQTLQHVQSCVERHVLYFTCFGKKTSTSPCSFYCCIVSCFGLFFCDCNPWNFSYFGNSLLGNTMSLLLLPHSRFSQNLKLHFARYGVSLCQKCRLWGVSRFQFLGKTQCGHFLYCNSEVEFLFSDSAGTANAFFLAVCKVIS